jgi:hypothetical protein
MKYALKDSSGLFATNDTRTGPCLTKIAALAYVWTSKKEAESVVKGFSSAIGTDLVVVEIE